MKSIRTLSLFSGAGGLDIGFHQAGFDVVACLEIDLPSCETLRLNVGTYVSPHTKIMSRDITTTDPSSLDLGAIDFIIGGPPCQSFSAAGRRAGGVHGINDTRGSLFWYYCNFLNHFKPSGFLFENVAGILQGNKKSDWKIILKSFESVGYKLYYRILDAADYGTPQHRERLILVGVRNDIEHQFLFPKATHGPAGVETSAYVTPSEALSDLLDPDEMVPPYGGKYGHLLENIPPGMNYLYYTERMGHPNPLFAWRSKFSGFLYKLPKDEPSKTVVAHQGRYDGPFHWNNRKLTIDELKRIQGFPDDYRFVASKVEAVRQIGNSVAPRMSFKLAQAVKVQFFGASDHQVILSHNDDDRHLSKRKAEKAASTKRKTATLKASEVQQFELPLNKKNYQLALSFNEEIETDRGKFRLAADLSDGTWNLKVDADNPNTRYVLKGNLSFVRSAGCQFSCINVQANCEALCEVRNFWDAIHNVVERSSSYEGLLPLYGHFTEPYPKFVLSFNVEVSQPINDLDRKLVDMMIRMSDFSFLSRLHSYKRFFKNSMEAIEVIQTLRSYGYDVRTHETNRAIRPGYFKACYPFTDSSKVNRYITWRHKGSHHTGDVKVSIKDGKVILDV
jgi:DNA (cytosine-5)-methyltransferase 1